MEELEKALNNISSIEDLITKSFGGEIWGYANIISSKTSSLEIKIASLTNEQKELIYKYIENVNQVLITFDLEAVLIEKDNSYSELDNITIAFIEASSLLYNLRYAKAKSEAAEYKMLRIYTWLEIEMLKKGNLLDDPSTAITIAIPLSNELKIKENGDIDIELTKVSEENSHIIKTFLSQVTHAKSIQNTLFQAILDNTNYGMIPRLYEEAIYNMCENLIKIISFEPINNVYSYLSRGYTLAQSLNNVNSYYLETLKGQKFSFLPEMKEYNDLLDKEILAVISKLPQLEETTIQEFTNDVKKEVAKILAYGLAFPSHYYQLNFRKANPIYESEIPFDFIVDSYIYKDNKLLSDYPIETYALVLTDDAKTAIFERVTNGQINPNYTLQDYLKYIPYKKS